MSIPNGGGAKISREAAILMLKHGVPEGLVIMSKEYGELDCADCDECALGHCDHADDDKDHTPEDVPCPHWTGINDEDLETIEEDEDYKNFELWTI